MPRLPTGDELTRSIPQGRTGVAAPRANPTFDFSGVQNAANALVSVGDAISELDAKRRQREDRLQSIRAIHDFRLNGMAVENGLERDEDYGTYTERYKEQMLDARSKAAENISDERIREEFVLQTDLDLAEGLFRVEEKAFRKEKELGRATVDNQITNTLEAITRAPDDFTRTQLIEDIGATISAAQSNQYYTAEEATNLRQGFAKSYADTRLKALGAREALEAIDRSKKENTWVRMADPDLVASIKEKAQAIVEEEELTVKSQQISNNILLKYQNSETPLRDMMREAGKYEGKLGDEIIRRVTNKYNVAKSIEEEEQKAAYNQISLAVAEGEMSMDNLTTEQKLKLTPSQRKNIEDIENKLASGDPIKTDWGTWTELMSMDNSSLSRINPADFRTKLSDTEYKQVVNRWSEAKSPDAKIDYLYTGVTYANDKAKAAGIKKGSDDYDRYMSYVNRELVIAQQNGEKISDQLKNKIVDDALIEVRQKRSLFGIDLLLPDKKSSHKYAIDSVEKVPDEDVEMIREAWQEEYGYEPTDQDIIRSYLNAQ